MGINDDCAFCNDHSVATLTGTHHGDRRVNTLQVAVCQSHAKKIFAKAKEHAEHTYASCEENLYAAIITMLTE